MFVWWAYVLKESGRIEEASELLDKVSTYLDAEFSLDRLDGPVTQSELHTIIQRSEIAAVRGDKVLTLEYLKMAVDAGWLTFWFHFLYNAEMSRLLEDDAEFLAIRDRVTREANTQLSRVRSELGEAY